MIDHRSDTLRDNLTSGAMTLALIRSGAVLTGYELVRRAITDDVRDFFEPGFQDGDDLEFRYAAEVLTLGKNPTESSIRWLVREGALTVEHVASLQAVRTHRDQVARQLGRLLVEPDVSINVQLLVGLRDIVRALDMFWAPLHLAASSENEVAVRDFYSGTRLLFALLCEVAQLDDER